MIKYVIVHGCTAALLFCAGQLPAQEPAFAPLNFERPRHTGVQAFDPPRKWHGLDLKTFFGYANEATGSGALSSCTSCQYNAANGWSALYSCTTCSFNVGVGTSALGLCTSCSGDIAIGYQALNDSYSGQGNVAVGNSALLDNSSNNNVAVGSLASENSQASSSTAVGATALEWGENYSTAVGFQAMIAAQSTTGYNVAVGAYALDGTPYGPTTYLGIGTYNVAVGAYAMYIDSVGNDNTAVGYQSLYYNKSGSFNDATGLISLYSNTSGSGNVADGLASLYGNTTGTENTGIGMESMTTNTTGTYNTGLGYGANVGSGALTNATALGANARVNSSNQVVIGNTAVTSIGGYAGWSNFSDGRFKKNIQQNVPGLAFINKLNPVTYTLDIAGIEAKLHHDEPSFPANAAGAAPSTAGARRGPQDDPVMKQAMQEKAAITYTGFVAQEVEKTAESVGFVFSGVDKPKNTEQSFYGLRYSDFVPPLVKAVQELSASSDKKDSVINALQGKFDSLQTQVNELRAMVLAQRSLASGATLEQNAPNPFTGSTVIGYSLPPGVSSAQLQITDAAGKVLATVPLSGSGRNTVTANVSGFAAGTYQYSLIVNGKLVSTRQMMSIR